MSEIFPDQSLNDLAHERSCDIIKFGEFDLGSISLADVFDLKEVFDSADVVFGKFGLVERLSMSMPTLPNGIEFVFLGRSEEEVFRSDAGRIIATMTNEETIRDLSVGQFPSDSMGSARVSSSMESELAITVSADRACPDPAISGLVYFAPKQGLVHDH